MNRPIHLLVLTLCTLQPIAPFAADRSTTVGAPLTIEQSIDLPERAYPALEAHVKTLIAAQPLPWPFSLKSVEVKEGRISLSGSVTQPGTYEIPFGVLNWNGRLYTLPTIACKATSPSVKEMRVADMLWPFPKALIQLPPPLIEEQRDLLHIHQALSFYWIFWQSVLRQTLSLLCALGLCAPLIVQGWKGSTIVHKPPIRTVNPYDILQQAKSLKDKGEVPWSYLVHALNLVVSDRKGSLTSYELSCQFENLGNLKLAQASTFIEEYGYSPESSKYIDRAFNLVEQAIPKSP